MGNESKQSITERVYLENELQQQIGEWISDNVPYNAVQYEINLAHRGTKSTFESIKTQLLISLRKHGIALPEEYKSEINLKEFIHVLLMKMPPSSGGRVQEPPIQVILNEQYIGPRVQYTPRDRGE